jgi:hypothetical protein
VSLDSGVTPLEHLVAACAVAILVSRSWTRPGWREPKTLLAVVGLVFLPVAFLPLPAALGQFVVGKEGLVEVATAGLLGGLAARAFSARQPWVLLGAVALLLEEIDYAQWLTGVSTPGWLSSASGVDALNSHHLPGLEAVWRFGPVAACVALSLRARWPVSLSRLAARIRLPTLHPAFLPAVVGVALARAAVALLGARTEAGEVGELAMVALVALAWRSSASEGGPDA